MSPNKANNDRSLLAAQVVFLRITVLSLAVVILAGVVLVGFLLLRDTTKVVPPEVRRPYEIGADYANKEYLADMATYVLDKVLTTSPEQVDFNNKVILRMTHPDGAAHLKTSLDASALRMKKEKITTVWAPRAEEIFEREKRVKVTGKLKTYIADKLTSERDKTYFVEFTVTTSGRLYVTKIEEFIKASTPIQSAGLSAS